MRITSPDAIATLRAMGPDMFQPGWKVLVKNGGRTALGSLNGEWGTVTKDTYTVYDSMPRIWANFYPHRHSRGTPGGPYYILLEPDCIAEVEIPDD